MNRNILHCAVIGALFFTTSHAMATGFVTLPATGFAVPGGTSAYTLCNITGNFGSGESTPPTFSPGGGANNTCAVPNNNPPIAGYRQIGTTQTRNININGRTIGTISDKVYRSGSNCVYGAKIRLNNVDYDPNTAGTQYFEVNDMVRSGFNGRGPISIAYNFVTRGPSQSDEVLYRAGLTSTSVAHPVGADDRPLTSVAPINQNAVDFTSDINFLDPDGSSMRDSPWFFVKSTCNSTGNPVSVAGAIKVRETGQEGQQPLEISVTGFAP